jgi:hypothetical protein
MEDALMCKEDFKVRRMWNLQENSEKFSGVALLSPNIQYTPASEEIVV